MRHARVASMGVLIVRQCDAWIGRGREREHFPDELIEIERLPHHPPHELAVREIAQRVIGKSGQHDGAIQNSSIAVLDLTDDVEAVRTGNHQIEDEHVVVPATKEAQRRVTVSRAFDRDIAPPENRLHEELHGLVVIDDEESDGRINDSVVHDGTMRRVRPRRREVGTPQYRSPDSHKSQFGEA